MAQNDSVALFDAVKSLWSDLTRPTNAAAENAERAARVAEIVQRGTEVLARVGREHG